MIKFKSFKPLMDADDGLDIPNSAETGVEDVEVAEPQIEEGEEEQESAEPVESKTDSDAAFAQMRRELEAAKRENEAYKQKESEWNEERENYENALGQWFQGDHKAEQAIAHYQEVPVEQILNDMSQKKEAATLKSENEQLKSEINRYRFESMTAQDLADIKKACPDATIKNVTELGDAYFIARDNGASAVDAYKGLMLAKGEPPKSIGKVKTAQPKKDFFTRDEVEAMSPKERTNNFDTIRKSMSKW